MVKFAEFYDEIRRILPDLKVSANELMSKHTSFRIGGPAAIMAFPKNAEELSKLLKLSGLMDIKIAILGAGTNVLAPDEGMDSLVVCLKGCMDGMERIDQNHIRIAAGVTMTKAAVFAAKLGLSGLEFAHGIPGTVGGGIYMNAGAYGGEICQVCTEVEVMDRDGNLSVATCEQMGFSYRHSILEDTGSIVLSGTFALKTAPEEEIRAKMQELMKKRSSSQPLDLPSAGSAFKRPVGGYAAALIDQAGLRGFQIGGAAVSQKHAGFVVNLGGATAKDVKKLLNDVSSIVFEKNGIRLEPEVRIW